MRRARIKRDERACSQRCDMACLHCTRRGHTGSLGVIIVVMSTHMDAQTRTRIGCNANCTSSIGGRNAASDARFPDKGLPVRASKPWPTPCEIWTTRYGEMREEAEHAEIAKIVQLMEASKNGRKDTDSANFDDHDVLSEPQQGRTQAIACAGAQKQTAQRRKN
jgi:hypothetical protein